MAPDHADAQDGGLRMMLLWKEFRFEAGHKLPDNPEPHGHSYTARVYAQISDLKALEAACESARVRLDHKWLNDVPNLGEPTMENIARYIWIVFTAFPIFDCGRVKRIVVERPSLGVGVEWTP